MANKKRRRADRKKYQAEHGFGHRRVTGNSHEWRRELPKPLKCISLSEVTELEKQGHVFQLARSDAYSPQIVNPNTGQRINIEDLAAVTGEES